MKAFKSNILELFGYGPMYIGIEYDPSANLTVQSCIVVGFTLIFKNPDEKLNQVIVGNKVEILAKILEKNQRFSECPFEEFKNLVIGQRPPDKILDMVFSNYSL